MRGGHRRCLSPLWDSLEVGPLVGVVALYRSSASAAYRRHDKPEMERRLGY